jgi:hypothetical protein
MRAVMCRYLGLAWIMGLVVACGGAEFSAGGVEPGSDGSMLAVDAAGDDATIDAPIGSRDSGRDRDIMGKDDGATGTVDGAIGPDDGATLGGDATSGSDTGAADAPSPDSGDGSDAAASDAGPVDAGTGSGDASCSLVCGFLCCPTTYHCCNGSSTMPSCVPKNSLCPLL